MAVLLGFFVTPSVLAQDKDTGIVDRTDPEYPEPKIGKRNLTLDLELENTNGTVTQAVLYHSRNRSALVDRSGGFPVLVANRRSIEATTTELGVDLIRAKAMLPWEKPSDRALHDNGPSDAYPAGTTVYYRWVITRQKSRGEPTLHYSKV
ncbi:MAG: hypothetical protein VYB61_10190, partial [Verrucomicrobiota bacterium]|nr:hypothetical protein [Verrucomicrobiota bacterium]